MVCAVSVVRGEGDERSGSDEAAVVVVGARAGSTSSSLANLIHSFSLARAAHSRARWLLHLGKLSCEPSEPRSQAETRRERWVDKPMRMQERVRVYEGWRALQRRRVDLRRRVRNDTVR